LINIIVCGLMFKSTGASDCDTDGYVSQTETHTGYNYDYYSYGGYGSYTYSTTTNACSDTGYIYFWVLWSIIAIMAMWLAPIGCGIFFFFAVGSESGGTVVNQGTVGHAVVPGQVVAPPQPTINLQSLSALRAQLQSIPVKELRAQAASMGIPPHLVEDARDSDDPRAAIVELIVGTRSKQPGWGP
jgi:hypothetical protein